MLHMSLFANSEKEMRFPSYNFYLMKRLDEPVQFKTRLQFGRAHQPAGTNPWLTFNTMNLGVHGELVGIATGVFQAWNSHAQARKGYGSEISKGKLIKVMIGLAEPLREGDTIQCLLMGQRSSRIHKLIQRIQGGFRVIQCDSGFKYIVI
jgi:hypothetical protein